MILQFNNNIGYDYRLIITGYNYPLMITGYNHTYRCIDRTNFSVRVKYFKTYSFLSWATFVVKCVMCFVCHSITQLKLISLVTIAIFYFHEWHSVNEIYAELLLNDFLTIRSSLILFIAITVRSMCLIRLNKII